MNWRRLFHRRPKAPTVSTLLQVIAEREETIDELRSQNSTLRMHRTMRDRRIAELEKAMQRMNRRKD